MNQLHRISVSVLVFAALSLAPAAQAIDITYADSSKVGSEISPLIGGPSTEESIATDTSFPQHTTVGSGGLTASADWTFDNGATSAVFSVADMVATVSALGASAKNYVDLEFTVGSAVDYSISGGVSWINQQGHTLAATLLLSRDSETIVEIDESVISPGLFFPSPFTLNLSDVATGDATGILEPGTYKLSFSVSVGPGAAGTNSVTTNFSVVLDESGGSSEPLIGGTPVDGLEGWYLSEWFGYYSPIDDAWLLHDKHGFIYRYPGSSNASMFFYDDAMGCWWWTSESIYPYMYLFDPPADTGGTDIGAAMVFYFEETMSPRAFVVLGTDPLVFLYFNP